MAGLASKVKMKHPAAAQQVSTGQQHRDAHHYVNDRIIDAEQEAPQAQIGKFTGDGALNRKGGGKN